MKECIIIFLIIILYILIFGIITFICYKNKENFKGLFPYKSKIPKSKIPKSKIVKNENLKTKESNTHQSWLNKTFNPSERINYYLGNLKNPMQIKLFNKDFNSKIYIINSEFFHDTHDTSELNGKYLQEMKTYYQNFKRNYPKHNQKQFIFLPGDVSHSREDVPFLTKTRPIKVKGKNVILPLNIERHWKPIFKVPYYDIPYDNKKNIMIWRGAATGRDKRVPLVETYFNYPGFEIDVGFTRYNDNYRGKKSQKFIKNKLHMGEMLQCKFLISVEGNDVASNLKWIMASNSLCIRPHSETESWLMEGKLQPWVHYVPVKSDFSDLLDIYKWCLANPDKCKDIIKNSKEYINQFMNGENEKNIVNKVIEKYASLTNIF